MRLPFNRSGGREKETILHGLIGQLRLDTDRLDLITKRLDARIDGAVADITALREQVASPAPARTGKGGTT